MEQDSKMQPASKKFHSWQFISMTAECECNLIPQKQIWHDNSCASTLIIHWDNL